MPLGPEPAWYSTRLLITGHRTETGLLKKNHKPVQPNPATGKSPNMSVCYIGVYQANWRGTARSALGWLPARAACRGWLPLCKPGCAAGCCRGIGTVQFTAFLVKAKLNNDPAKSFHFQCCVRSQPRVTCSRNPIRPYFWEKRPLHLHSLPVPGWERPMLQRGCWPWLTGSGAS